MYWYGIGYLCVKYWLCIGYVLVTYLLILVMHVSIRGQLLAVLLVYVLLVGGVLVMYWLFIG